MCRHTAYLGEPKTLQRLLLDPPHGLVRQSWAPRRQRHGTVNADGFGVGWYDPSRLEPARIRHAVPMWNEASFGSLAGVVRSGCVLGAVRSATEGGPRGVEACAPFLLPAPPGGSTDGRGVLLSHNGRLSVDAVAPLVDAAALARFGTTVDSAFLAALVLDRLDDGLERALTGAVLAVREVAPEARLNLLATDGERVVATACGDTLFWCRTGQGMVVASEPSDDDHAWHEVPDESVLHHHAGDDACVVTPLEGL